MGLENDPDFWKMTLESDSPKRSLPAVAEGEAQIAFPIVLLLKPCFCRYEIGETGSSEQPE